MRTPSLPLLSLGEGYLGADKEIGEDRWFGEAQWERC